MKTNSFNSLENILHTKRHFLMMEIFATGWDLTRHSAAYNHGASSFETYDLVEFISLGVGAIVEYSIHVLHLWSRWRTFNATSVWLELIPNTHLTGTVWFPSQALWFIGQTALLFFVNKMPKSINHQRWQVCAEDIQRTVFGLKYEVGDGLSQKN